MQENSGRFVRLAAPVADRIFPLDDRPVLDSYDFGELPLGQAHPLAKQLDLPVIHRPQVLLALLEFLRPALAIVT